MLKQKPITYNLALTTTIILISSCMHTPALRHDYSTLENDFFTAIIKEIRGEKNSFLIIDIKKGEDLSRRYFRGKKSKQTSEIFYLAEGGCITNKDTTKLNCSISRTWRYTNIGAPIHPTHWCAPGMKLIYEFNLTKKDHPDPSWSSLTLSYKDIESCSNH